MRASTAHRTATPSPPHRHRTATAPPHHPHLLTNCSLACAAGSLPVVIVIVPSTALGATLIMSNRPGWDVASQLVTLIAVGAQLGVTIGFAAVIERAATVYATQIAELPMDEEVAALDEQIRRREEAWRAASDWRRENYPPAAKAVIISAAVIGGMACHLSVLIRCFEMVTVADPYDGPPLFGNPLNVVRGLPGWCVIAGFGLSSLLLWAHRKWLSSEVAKQNTHSL